MLNDITGLILGILFGLLVVWSAEDLIFSKIYGKEFTFSYWIKKLFVKLGWMKNK